jgi:hypothetical protein
MTPDEFASVATASVEPPRYGYTALTPWLICACMASLPLAESLLSPVKVVTTSAFGMTCRMPALNAAAARCE